MAIELKVGKNQTTDAQLEWIAALDGVPGITALVVWPEDEDRLYALLDGQRDSKGENQ